MIEREKITLNKLLSKTYNELTQAKESLESSYIILDKINKGERIKKDAVENALFNLAASFGIISDWIEYYRQVQEVIIDESENNQTLKERIKYLENLNNYKDEVMNNLVKNNGEALRNALELIEENAKLIAASKGNREKQRVARGANSNKFIQEIDNDELVSLYSKAGYKLTKEILEYYNSKTSVTYQGLKVRLQSLGVWKGRE